MSTHFICFHGEMWKLSTYFGWQFSQNVKFLGFFSPKNRKRIKCPLLQLWWVKEFCPFPLPSRQPPTAPWWVIQWSYNSLSKENCSERLFLHYKNTPIQIYRKFHLQKLKIFRWKTLIFFIILLKTKIVGTLLNHLGRAVLTSTYNLCFRAKIRKIMYTL